MSVSVEMKAVVKKILDDLIPHLNEKQKGSCQAVLPVLLDTERSVDVLSDFGARSA